MSASHVAIPTNSVPGLSSPSKLTPTNQSKSTRSLPVPGYYTGVPLHLLKAAQQQQRGLRKNGLDPLHPGDANAAAAAAGNGLPSTLTKSGAPAGLIAGNAGTHGTTTMPFSDFVRLKQSVDDARSAPAAAAFQPDYKRHTELVKEKERLHEQSVAMVAKWNNTIAGQRKIRLAAQQEKSRIAEEQRQQMDKDWAVVKAAERQAMVERAKKMQYLEDARVRQLNSQALITQVLKERKAQLDYKRAEQALQAQQSQEELAEELARLAAADAEAAEMQRRCKQMMLDTAAQNRHMSEARRAEQARERAELREWFARASERAAEELREMEAARAKKKQDQTKELVAVLDWAVADRQVRDVQATKEDSELERINAEIIHIKESIARKRKAAEVALIRSRIARNEYVGSLQVPVQQECLRERDELLAKIEHAHEGELEARLRAEAEKRKDDMQSCVDAMHRNIAEKEHQKMLERLEAAEIRKKNEEVARSAMQSAGRRKDRLKKIQRDFGNVYRKEISDHNHVAAVAKQTRKKEHLQAMDEELQRDLDFHNYAASLIAELKGIGNNPTPVVKKLEEMELNPRARYQFLDEEIDTFHRLGFEPHRDGPSGI
ncbi:hypothetical protein H9P43_007607 [Blastocladiella emersonii ATCC 22665]|nr:hypothetical protein H9P43_007607 [Blastocladiella emersonii ATCC 22665]